MPGILFFDSCRRFEREPWHRELLSPMAQTHAIKFIQITGSAIVECFMTRSYHLRCQSFNIDA
jgi:hypothetical protein